MPRGESQRTHGRRHARAEIDGQHETERHARGLEERRVLPYAILEEIEVVRRQALDETPAPILHHHRHQDHIRPRREERRRAPASPHAAYQPPTAVKAGHDTHDAWLGAVARIPGALERSRGRGRTRRHAVDVELDPLDVDCRNRADDCARRLAKSRARIAVAARVDATPCDSPARHGRTIGRTAAPRTVPDPTGRHRPAAPRRRPLPRLPARALRRSRRLLPSLPQERQSPVSRSHAPSRESDREVGPRDIEPRKTEQVPSKFLGPPFRGERELDPPESLLEILQELRAGRTVTGQQQDGGEDEQGTQACNSLLAPRRTSAAPRGARVLAADDPSPTPPQEPRRAAALSWRNEPSSTKRD